MTTKSTSRSAATAADADATQNAMTQAVQAPMATLAQATASMMQATEILQQVNLHMIQRVALGQQQAAERLRQAGSPSDLMAAQVSLTMANMSETMQYMQELMAASLRIQGSLVSSSATQAPGMASTAASTVANTAANTAANTTAAMMNNPVMQAWQTLFRGALNGAAGLQPH